MQEPPGANVQYTEVGSARFVVGSRIRRRGLAIHGIAGAALAARRAVRGGAANARPLQGTSLAHPLSDTLGG